MKTFQQIWKQMDQARRRQAAEALCTGKEYAGEQMRAAGVIAVKLNLRPQKAVKLPAERKAAYLTSILALDEQLAGALVRAYLFTHHQAMLASFLDALKIPHKNGAISVEAVEPPSAEALAPALEQLRASFDPADVQLYLTALVTSDPITWANVPMEEAAPAPTTNA